MVRITAIALCLIFAGHVQADEPVDTAQSVIRAQIKAFTEDDAEAAYSFASPEIQAKFPDKRLFLDMVKRSYQHLYRPSRFAFGRAKVVGDEVVQEVLISGSDGKDWTAIYSLIRDADNNYRVSGVMMVQTAPGPEL
ncbi:DUF4864 domain-containing protein [Sinorhizobium meliloti WSM1022]|jgi:hypothetical protein|uniref:DUF4864 domain-containing protein n=1 Tax=Rhizobium meliloti TaxID=382 RepID=UPI0003FFA6EE|nr:DUF4864 domain-containing protein [Sinorhizobium meliloti]ASQ04118.1 DUF4864 domain-containing protein [Sinorhizobium meliloti]MCO6425252.1 DUF4864 domain-containing protein [Sinorhizobium meliloti]MDW9409611.1 DUF4864 domain-containing protein [Sinorhizobium meliloti]MDW9417550.1 DUF4864 domain-containing protein [Sinorhizobium meliloti]MDW9441026.1 DUF4864 domain-containing protein [Sinorhizobium meliloti]